MIQKLLQEKYFNICFNLTKNKSLEIELSIFPIDNWYIFNINTNWSIKGDHCGFKLNIQIFKLIDFNFDIYDHRHWDWDNNKYSNEFESTKKQIKIHCLECNTSSSKKWHTVNGNFYCNECLNKNLDKIIIEKIYKK